MKTTRSLLIGGHEISPIVIDTFMGHSGGRVFDIPPQITNLFPAYRELRRVIHRIRVTVFTKSSTLQRHTGNFKPLNPLTWKYIQRLDHDGLLNAYGLTNDGVEVNAKGIAAACKAGYNVIPNFYPFALSQEQTIAETLEAIAIYLRHLGPYFWALELNFSCPNAKEKIRENMQNALACVVTIRQKHPNLILIAKISIVHPYEFAQDLIDAGVNVIHAINTIPYNMVYPQGPPSPLQAVGGGGVSGGPAFSQALSFNRVLRRRISAPIIMGCGVMDVWDVETYRRIGANAVSICTICRLNPHRAVKLIEEYAT